MSHEPTNAELANKLDGIIAVLGKRLDEIDAKIERLANATAKGFTEMHTVQDKT